MKQFIAESIDLLSLPQTKVALLGILGSVATPFAMPAAYQDRVGAVIGSICTLSTLLVAGISYERGKQAEGTVPAGSTPVNPPPAPTVVNVQLPPTTVATLPQTPEQELTTLDAVKNFTSHAGNVATKLIVGLLLLSCFAGCQAAPLTQADLATTTMDGAVKVLIVARQNKLISDSDKANVSAVLHSADAALKTYVADAQASPTSTQTQLDAAAFWSAFASVEPYVVKYSAAKAPTTKPTTQKGT